MITAVCFSKDRPMQLEAYLESLMHYSGIKQEMIAVLTAESAPINYDLTRSHLPKINWVAEQNFYEDLMRTLEDAEKYILFGCDDVVYKDYFDANECIRVMQQDPEVFGFSLRLGENLNFIPRLQQSDGVLKWYWAKSNSDYWNYPWEVSATLYRRDAVLDLLRSRSDLSNPNRLEAYVAQQIANGETRVPPRLACFPTSCAMTITVNRVQDEFPNEFDEAKATDPATLYREYLDGVRQDWPKLSMYRNDGVHVGAEAFHLTSLIDPPKQQYALVTGKERQRNRSWGLAAKFVWWRVMTSVWELVRSMLPRPMLNALKAAIRKVR